MGRTINIALVFSICFALSWCDNGTPQQPSGKEQTPSPQNQADSKPLSGEQHWIRGNLLRAEAKYEEATTEYQLAIDKGYDSNWARTELGMVLDHYLHRPEEAIKHFRVAIQRDENDWRAHWLLANSLLSTMRL